MCSHGCGSTGLLDALQPGHPALCFLCRLLWKVSISLIAVLTLLPRQCEAALLACASSPQIQLPAC
jgi:hypothetical protein